LFFFYHAELLLQYLRYTWHVFKFVIKERTLFLFFTYRHIEFPFEREVKTVFLTPIAKDAELGLITPGAGDEILAQSRAAH